MSYYIGTQNNTKLNFSLGSFAPLRRHNTGSWQNYVMRNRREGLYGYTISAALERKTMASRSWEFIRTCNFLCPRKKAKTLKLYPITVLKKKYLN